MNSEAKILGIVGLVTLAVVIAAVVIFSRQGSPSSNAETIDQSKLVRETSHRISTDSAKVTIVEFADFQCPACKAAYPVIQRIKMDFKNDITFVYRNFPLMQHRYGKISAKAAESAAEQGKFWEMYEKLYTNQEEWSNSPNPQEQFDKYASEIGLDPNKFKEDMNSSVIDDRINNDVSDALDLEVNSTPTLFVNGERLTGAPSYETLKSKIESKLNRDQ